MRKWRNWQTRTFEGRVVYTVRVQVPSLAPISSKQTQGLSLGFVFLSGETAYIRSRSFPKFRLQFFRAMYEKYVCRKITAKKSRRHICVFNKKSLLKIWRGFAVCVTRFSCPCGAGIRCPCGERTATALRGRVILVLLFPIGRLSQGAAKLPNAGNKLPMTGCMPARFPR